MAREFRVVLWVLPVLLLTPWAVSSCQGQGPTGGEPAAPARVHTQSERAARLKQEQGPKEFVRTVSPELGATLRFDQVEVVIPPRAVREAVSMTLGFPREVPSGVLGDRAWELSPRLTFDKPVRITLPLPTDLIRERGLELERVKVAREVGGVWFSLPTEISPAGTTASALTERSGIFALVYEPPSRKEINEPPKAEVTLHPPTEATSGEEGRIMVAFDAMGSLDPDGHIVRFAWDFDGDGLFDEVTSSPERVAFYYTRDGSYTALLKVEDNHSPPGYDLAPVSFEINGTGNQGGPLSLRVVALPTRGPSPLKVAFLTTVTGGTMPYEFQWEFGDGTRSELASPVHTYGEPGSYQVRLTVTDAAGLTKSAKLGVKVTRPGLPFPSTDLLSLTLTPREAVGNPGMRVGFSLRLKEQLEPGVRAAVTYRFGDELDFATPPEIGRLPLSVSHTYREAGAYLFTAIVTDELGRVGTASSLVRVRAASEPRAWEFVQPEGEETGELPSYIPPIRIKFDPRGPGLTYAFQAEGLPKEAEVVWEFGDGTESPEPAPVHTYTDPGTYRVGLEVSYRGRVYRYFKTLPVAEGLAVAVDFPQSFGGVAPLQLGFTATVVNATLPLEYEWDFGDGSKSDLPSPIHTFEQPGTYEVKVRVVDATGKGATSEPVKVMVVEGGKVFTDPVAFPLRGEELAGKPTPPVWVRITDADQNPILDLPLGSEDGEVRNLVLSPDGSMLAYRVAHRLAVRSLRSGKLVLEYEAAGVVPELVALAEGAELMGVNLAGQGVLVSSTGCEVELPPGSRLADLSRSGERVLVIDPEGKLHLGEVELSDECRGSSAGQGSPQGKKVSRIAKWEELPSPVAIEEAIFSGDALSAYAITRRQEVIYFDLREGADRAPTVIGQDELTKSSLSSDYAGTRLAWIASGVEGARPVVAVRQPDGTFKVEDLYLTRGILAEKVRVNSSGTSLYYWGTKGLPRRIPTAEEAVRERQAVPPREVFPLAQQGGAEPAETAEGEELAGAPAIYRLDLTDLDRMPTLVARAWQDFAVAEVGRR